MDAIATMKYGTEEVEIPIKGASSIETILPNEMSEIEDVPAAFLKAITTDVIGSDPLNQVISAEDLVTIVVSDVTRCWMRADLLMPLLVNYLHDECGVSYDNIEVVIALGTHRHTLPEEFARIVSQEVLDKVHVADHDCDADDLVYVGTTSRGTKVEVNPLVIGRKVIVMGGTVHHMMAGFGGGRKNLLPGVAGRNTIRQNHERALDPNAPHTDRRVGCCKLLENPIHEDMMEAASFVDVAFSVNIVVAASGVQSGFFCGALDEAWKASCDYQRNCYEVPIDYQADIVICSSGGYPKDMHLYQGCKGMLNAMRSVKKDGLLIWACQCPEGGGAPDYFKWLEPLREGHLDESLRADFTIGGYIFYLTVETLAHAECLTYTMLDSDLVAPMGMTASNNLEELLSKVDFTDKSVYLMPYAGNVVPIFDEED